MELLNSLCFGTFVSMNQVIYLELPRPGRNANGVYWGEEELAADQDHIPWKTKPWLAEQRMLMKLHPITWLKDFSLIGGGARQTALQRGVLRLAFKQRAQEEERKNHLQDHLPLPSPNALQPRRNPSPGARVIQQQRQFKH